MTAFINNELLLLLKRSVQLQSSFGIFMSLVDMKSKDACNLMATQLAHERVHEIIPESVDYIPKCDDVVIQPLNGHFRRACLLLDVSPIYFSHTAMKYLVQLGYTVSLLTVLFIILLNLI